MKKRAMPKGTKKVSEQLLKENKVMEEKLNAVKALLEKEKQEREKMGKPVIDKNGNIWNSASTSKPITGYSQFVLEQHSKDKKKQQLAKQSKLTVKLI